MTDNTDITSSTQSALTPLIGLIVIFTIFALLNIPVLATIWENSFDDGTYSHAYLIPFISMFLYYKLSATGQLTYRNSLSPVPVILLCCSCAVLFITATAQISLGYWGAMLAILLSSVMVIYRVNWQIIFPTLFLVFLIPGWGLLTPILQEISVNSVTFLMSFSGIPTFVEGNFVTIPAGVFEIADGCSGLRYLIVSLAISSLFNFLYIKSTKKVLMFFSVAILGALLTNWIRITALILIGEYTNMQSSLMSDHNTFGWYLYIPFMVLLFMWGNKLADNDILSNELTSAKTLIKTYPALSNVLVLLILTIISSTSLKALVLSPVNAEAISTKINPIIPNYTHVEQKLLSQNGSEVITLNYFFNGALTNGKPTAHDNNFIPLGWHSINQEVIEQWMYVTIASKNKTALIRYTFEINKQQTASSSSFKKQRLLAAMKGNSETYLYWQYTVCSNSCDKEKKVFQQDI